MFLTDIEGKSQPLNASEPNVKRYPSSNPPSWPDSNSPQRNFIEAFTGEYEMPDLQRRWTVSLRGVKKQPGTQHLREPDHLLTPKRGTTFQLMTSASCIVSIEFKAAVPLVKSRKLL